MVVSIGNGSIYDVQRKSCGLRVVGSW